MTTGDVLLRGTAWLAFAGYVAGEFACLRGRQSGPSLRAWRWLTTIGCVCLLGHILSAFHFRHDWSHAIARADTARQTAALTGWNWGGGIYVNYAFALVWLAIVVRLWTGGLTARRSRAGRSWVVRACFLFMFLNAAVVFVSGPARWVGLGLSLLLVGLWMGWGKKEPSAC